MAITLGSNIASLMTQRNISGTTHNVSKLYDTSSGLRIVRASDDAAGLAIADSLRVDGRVYSQSIRNLNDGISVLNIAEGAVSQLSDIVIRIRELATQASNGTFGTKQRIALDQEAQALRAEYLRLSRSAEFNGNKLLDGSVQSMTVQAGYGPNGGVRANVGGLMGTGTFDAGTSYLAEGQVTYAVKFGDFNGDSINDIVSGGYDDLGDGYVTIRLGIGGGKFGGVAATMATESYSTFALALGDVNNDGNLDITTGGLTDAVTGATNVLLGNGNGTFKQAVSYASEEWYTRGLSLGDLNGDGILDMVSDGNSHIGTGKELHVRLGNGNGTFKAAVSYGVSASSRLALGDINGDNILDIAGAGGFGGAGYAEILLGRGDGTFGAIVSYTTESAGSRAVSLDDVNGDGKIDLLTSGSGTGSQTTVRLGLGNGTFGGANQFSLYEQISQSMTTGDFNGDGIIDIASAGYDSPGAGVMSILIGNGNGTFRATISYVTENSGSVGITSGDINSDGVADLATGGFDTASDGRVTIFTGQGQNGVAPLMPFSIRTMADAKWTMSLMSQKLTQLNAQRGTIGAFQSRITSALSNLGTTVENYAGAESRLRDVDIAESSAELVRLQILQQASVSILGRANVEPQLALQLLSG